MMVIPRTSGLIGAIVLLLLIPGCLNVGTSSLQIDITGLSVIRQFCDLALQSSYEIRVTWHAQGGMPPLTVLISYRTPEGQTQTFGPFSWPEQQDFTMLVDSYEGESLLVQALVQDKDGVQKEAKRWLRLRPCASLPPMKPLITIVPSEGTAIQEYLTIEATMTNTLGVPILAKTLIALGCTVEHSQPTLPLVLGPHESKRIQINLRCPEGGATWRLGVEIALTL
jgi:hypothetical protein